uniref:Uncharacterized protein n=1 Tax=Rhipicephalus zambeziensis TaxID=60191 RepID=A0A224YLC5_9ACAR
MNRHMCTPIYKSLCRCLLLQHCSESPGEGTNALHLVDHVTEKSNLVVGSFPTPGLISCWSALLCPVFAANNSSASACWLPISYSCVKSWKPRNVLPL